MIRLTWMANLNLKFLFLLKHLVKIMKSSTVVVGNSSNSSIFPSLNIPAMNSAKINCYPPRTQNAELESDELNTHMVLDLSYTSSINKNMFGKFVQHPTKMMEDPVINSTNHRSDVVKDSSVNSEASFVLKPPHSYIGLIAMAILSCSEYRKTLAQIYEWIAENYPYFRWRGTGWRNSIRHNLSLNDCFVKINRASNGKGHYWTIHPANLHDFMNGDFRRKQAQWKVKSHFVFGQAILAAFATANASNHIVALQPSSPEAIESKRKVNDDETSFRSIESMIIS